MVRFACEQHPRRSRCRDRARLVAVEEEDELRAAGAGEQLDLLQGERRAAGGDRGAEARLVQRDDVEVALDEERSPGASDRLPAPGAARTARGTS